MSSSEMDFGGLDLVVRSVRTGATAPGQGATSTVTKAAGATLTLAHNDVSKTILLDTLTGSVVTLPAATGSGDKYKFVVSVLATSGSHKVQVANGSDAMQGIIVIEDTDTSNATLTFAATAGTSDTISLNRSTTGSVTVGEWFEVHDIAANKWQVNGVLTATGNPATPFSAAVS